jgi:selT/selW/selH-like putative selenoprotein
LAAEIRKAKGIEAKLVRGGGGVFEVTANGQLIFSKKATGRFPEAKEILDKLAV